MAKNEYWRRRLAAEMKAQQEADLDIKNEFERLHNHYYLQIDREIEAFYNRYAENNQISRAEANKLVSDMDVEVFADKAKRYVKEKNFSPEANRELAVYNLKMKVNRLELLQYNLELEMVALADEEFKMTEKYLNDEYVNEMRRQAGILGETVPEPATLRGMGQAIINTPYKGAVWSERLWNRQNVLRGIVGDIAEDALFKGKNATKLIGELRREFDVNSYEARRLAVTEVARVQTAVQKDNYERNEIEEYEYIAEPTACEICAALDGKIFKVVDMEPGKNACPMHPFCHCGTAGHLDRAELDRMFEEFEAMKKDGIMDTKDEFEKKFDGFDINRGRRAMTNDMLKRLDVPAKKVSIRKGKGSRGYNKFARDKDGIVSIDEFYLQSDDDRAVEYQTKTMFHEAYHAKASGSTIDYGQRFDGFSWTDIEETFAETSSHYAVQALGIEKKLSPAYPQILVDTLPRLKQLEKYQNASSLADFGKIAWKDRLDGTPSMWQGLAKELDGIDHDWQTYGLQYEPYINSNKDAMFSNFIENSPRNNDPQTIETMKEELASAFEKTRNGQPLNANENWVYTGVLATAMNQTGVW